MEDLYKIGDTRESGQYCRTCVEPLVERWEFARDARTKMKYYGWFVKFHNHGKCLRSLTKRIEALEKEIKNGKE